MLLTFETAIIIPAFNAEKYISEAIESCSNQSGYDKFCIIVVDDCSNDNTANFFAKVPDNVFYYKNSANFGAAKSRNIGAKIAIEKHGCKYLHFFDADDIACDTMLSEKIGIIKDDIVSVVYSGYYNMTDCGETTGYEIKPIFNYHRLIEDNYISMISMIKAKIFMEIGGLNPYLTYCEDWDLYLRAVEKGIAVCIDKPLFKYRANPNSQTRKIDWNIYGLDKNIVMAGLSVRKGGHGVDAFIEAQNTKIRYMFEKAKKCQA